MYKTSYRCTDCKHTFEKITKNFPKREPSCPVCRKNQRVSFKGSVSDKTHNLDSGSRVREMIEAKQAPSMGKSSFTKAMDATADIVMEDYGMTNLQDNLRAGDSMVPKLAPELERKVDEVFKPQKPIMGMQGTNSLNKALIAQINSGAFKHYSREGDIVYKQQSSGIRVPTNIIHDYQERPKPS